MDILLALFLVVFGLVITFAGLQVFAATLPILGFIFGFYLGGAAIHTLLDDGFLGTVTGWIVGFLVGLLFGAVAWYWWYAGVLLSAGTLGAVLATGLAEAIGIDSDVALFIFAVAGFVALVVLAFMFDAPIYLVILNTAGAGATILIAGVLLLIDRVDRHELGEGTATAIINESWWWALVWFIVTVVGIGVQLGMRERIRFPEERWVSAGMGRST
jgi:hypothetical protein